MGTLRIVVLFLATTLELRPLYSSFRFPAKKRCGSTKTLSFTFWQMTPQVRHGLDWSSNPYKATRLLFAAQSLHQCTIRTSTTVTPNIPYVQKISKNCLDQTLNNHLREVVSFISQDRWNGFREKCTDRCLARRRNFSKRATRHKMCGEKCVVRSA